MEITHRPTPIALVPQAAVPPARVHFLCTDRSVFGVVVHKKTPLAGTGDQRSAATVAGRPVVEINALIAENDLLRAIMLADEITTGNLNSAVQSFNAAKALIDLKVRAIDQQEILERLEQLEEDEAAKHSTNGHAGSRFSS